MADGNVFTNSLDQIGDWFRTHGTNALYNAPAPTPYPVRIVPAAVPQVVATPRAANILTDENFQSATPYDVGRTTPAPSRSNYPAVATGSPGQTGVTPLNVYNPNAPAGLTPRPLTMQPTGNVTGAPTGSFQAPVANPATNTYTPGVMPPAVYPGGDVTQIKHDVTRQDGSKTTVVHKAPPLAGATQTGDPDPDQPYLRAAAQMQQPQQPQQQSTQQSQQPSGRTINLGAPQSNYAATMGYSSGYNPPPQAPQPGGPPHDPGLLERLGATVAHFFQGSLGQNRTAAPAAAATAPRSPAGHTHALSGIHQALRKTAPNQVAQPPAPTDLAYNPDWTPTPLGSPDITRPALRDAQGNLIDPTQQPLIPPGSPLAVGSTITNPLYYRST